MLNKGVQSLLEKEQFKGRWGDFTPLTWGEIARTNSSYNKLANDSDSNGIYVEDFVGFSFNGVHSSSLNIVRTSDGDRFDRNLSPDFDATTVEVKGMDKTLYFGSHYKKNDMTINIAFDSVTESQLRRINALFSDTNVRPIVFDEAPYKTYYAAISSVPTIHYIPFDLDGKRIYKGEGTISLTAYDPFARTDKKYLNEYKDENKDQWSTSSGMLDVKGNYDSFDNNGVAHLYNPGDAEAPFYYIIPKNNNGRSFTLRRAKKVIAYFETANYSGYDNTDTHLRYNFDLCIIEGGTMRFGNFIKSGRIYNQIITDGDFFKIPLGYTDLTVVNSDGQRDNGAQIIYDYLYY